MILEGRSDMLEEMVSQEIRKYMGKSKQVSIIQKNNIIIQNGFKIPNKIRREINVINVRIN